MRLPGAFRPEDYVAKMYGFWRPNKNPGLTGSRAWVWNTSNQYFLDPVADKEVVDDDAEPAGSEDGDRNEDADDNVEVLLLEDIQHAPDGGDDTQNVNNSC